MGLEDDNSEIIFLIFFNKNIFCDPSLECLSETVLMRDSCMFTLKNYENYL